MINPDHVAHVREIIQRPVSPENFENPIWRLGNLYVCVNKDGLKVDFKPNQAQCEVLYQVFVLGRKRVLILKARQLGMSTLIALIGLDYVLTNENSTFNIQSHNDEAAKDLLREKVVFPFAELDDAIKGTVDQLNTNQNELVFSPVWKIRSKVKIRGGTSQVLHISEWGKVAAKDPIRSEEILTGALPTAGPNAIVFIESTYEGGQAGHFYNQVKAAMEINEEHRLPTDFCFLFFPWYEDESYELKGNPDILTQTTLEYFESLAASSGTEFSTAQKIWWQKERDRQGIFMGREYPSTPEEAMSTPVEGAIYADTLEMIEKKGQMKKEILPNRDVPIWAVWDIGFRDRTAIWLVQYTGHELNWLWATQGSQKRTQDYLAEIGLSGFNVYGHIVPHDAAYMDKTGTKNYVMEMSARGATNIRVCPKTRDIWKGINDLRSLLHRSYFSRKDTEYDLKMLKMYRAELEEHKGGIMKTVPVHDHTSHIADAARYVAEGIEHNLLDTVIQVKNNNYQRRREPIEYTNGY
jgi:hypothetical protein